MIETPLFEVEQFISFSEGDPAGVVYFARIFDIAHKTLELFKVSQKGWDSWFKDPKYGWPLRHAEADFVAPIYVGRSIKARLFLDKQGERSIKFRCLIYQVRKQVAEAVDPASRAADDEVLCATVTTVHVRTVHSLYKVG